MSLLEIICLAILSLFVVFQLHYRPHPARLLRRLSLLAIAAWLGEDTVIRAYHFYSYSPSWNFFIDQVPAMIVLIWPVVIYSAWNLVGYLLPTSAAGWIVLAGSGIVLADASLIEPIAVQAGLWHWHEPGIFNVPPIGILGWAYFAGCCIFILEKNSRDQRNSAWDALVLVIPAICTHLLLLLTWWGALRWVNDPLAPGPVVVMAWGLSLVLTYRAWRKESAENVPLSEMLLRIPAVLFFVVLLIWYGRTNWPLIAYVLACSLPYLALTFRSDKKK